MNNLFETEKVMIDLNDCGGCDGSCDGTCDARCDFGCGGAQTQTHPGGCTIV